MKEARCGFAGLLTLLFAAGKIFGYLDWSWWWVFCPIWIPFVIVVILALLSGAAAGRGYHR